MVDAFACLTFYPLAGSRSPKFVIIHYGGDKAKSVFKVAKQLYWNHTSEWVFSCKFAACFQSTFS